MKKVKLICAGKIKEKFIVDGIEHYAKRLSRFCDFCVEEVSDYPDDENAAEKESEALKKKLGGYVVLFDIGGEALSSEKFAEVIDRAYSAGNDTVTFIIGGSHGVTDELKAAANKKISFGRVTYPHRLMRLIATEQIYRAFTILGGMPYHK